MGKASRLAAAAFALLAACTSAQPPDTEAVDAPNLAGHYRINAMEQAGELLLTPDGRFQYGFTTGALDEHAEGRWEHVGQQTCLTTDPKPVPPAFTKAAVTDPDAPTLMVTWPDGRGIAGVDFVVGFDNGEPQTGYTQSYGWTLPEEERRVPRWIELNEPIYNIASPRFALEAADRGKLRIILSPNEIGLNLVEVSPNADPPVCKYLDVGKHRYEAQKKANAARKTQKTQQIKEIKMRPNIDDHDYDVKMRSVTKFLEEGDKVKMTLRFRGREMAHNQLGMAVLQRVAEDTASVAKIEAHPRMEGRQMLMVISPK